MMREVGYYRRLPIQDDLEGRIEWLKQSVELE